ncbi:hypothetical protein FLONG3_1372 [Fusarium longipes]|uniref:Uncharacterized protein n=1 Tax=Fusarium longipes TaxID=694270 RepID=A0A395T743_9HYPO|nr:hypothetical protein FLONG3_1372 [Fusarium longipes]
MGFFSNIFTRKSNARRASVKGQDYHSTVASIPPIQGTYPVSGNGPSILDQLQRAARKRSQAQLSTVSRDVHHDNDSGAVPPMVPRYRGMSHSRPTTAPNQPDIPTSRPLSLSRSIRSSNSAWSVPDRPARGRIEDLPPVPSIPTHHRRESSTDSFQNKRNSFIDILDAQGEFRPSNFRSRVTATGSREYGEDVAERNLGENGLNFKSAATKAIYRLSGSGHVVLPTYEHNYEEDDDDCAPYPGVPHGDSGTKRDNWSKSGSSAWRRSYSGPVANDFSRSSKPRLREKRSESPIKQYFQINKRDQASLQPAILSKQERRRSFNAFASPPEEERQKPRPLTLHPSISSFSYERPSSPPILLPPVSPPASPPSVPRSRPKTSEGRSRRKSFGRVEIDTVEEDNEDFAPFPSVPSRSRLSEQRSTSYLESGYGYDRHDTISSRPESYHGGLHLSFPRNDIPQISRPSSSSSMDKSFNRTRTMTSARSQRLDDINEHIPIRSSSLWKAQPCITPSTMSSGFSNPFPKSVGNHTPSTSIDASLPPSIKLGPDHEQKVSDDISYYNPGDDDFSADTLVPSRREVERDLGHPMNEGLNLDLYLSDASEDSVDSFVAWKEKRRNEESLLMKDHYGTTGAGLPGLFEPSPILKASVEPPIPQIPIEPVSKRPKTPKSPRPSTRSSKSTPQRSQKSRQGRSRTTTPRRTVQTTIDDDSEWEDDIPSAPTAPGFVSLADLGINLRDLGWDQLGLTDADDAKVDIQTAMKLRKAMKNKKRQQKEAEEACAADVEDH